MSLSVLAPDASARSRTINFRPGPDEPNGVRLVLADRRFFEVLCRSAGRNLLPVSYLPPLMKDEYVANLVADYNLSDDEVASVSFYLGWPRPKIGDKAYIQAKIGDRLLRTFITAPVAEAPRAQVD